jgi:(p)ppGpp synthase/HD superfamily hydrolase
MEDIHSNFGPDIAVIVDGLTDVSVPSDGNRAVRKAMDRQHSADASYEAQFVKCADIIDNAADIGDNDPNFNIVYRKEMQLLLDVMTKVKGKPIYKAALKSVAI